MSDDVLVGRYRRLRTLGSGGMGEVWLAEDLDLGRQVAVKRLLAGGGTPDPDLVERMTREARVVARLNHPAIVTLHDLVRVDGSPFLIMQYVEGESLAERITRTGRLGWAEVAPIIGEIAGALAAAHRQGVLHRDIKPANILLDTDGHAHLADFGIARGTGDAALTRAGELVGTVAYMAPDIARGEPAGPASDVWSLGATLFAAVEGSAPFAGTDSSVPQMIARLIQHDAPPPEHAGPLTPLLTRMLATDPSVRPAAAEVVHEIPRLLALPPESTGAVRDEDADATVIAPPPPPGPPPVPPAPVPPAPAPPNGGIHQTTTMPEHPTAPDALAPAPSPDPARAPTRGGRGPLVAVAVVVLLVAVAVGGYLVLGGSDAPDTRQQGAPSGSTGSPTGTPTDRPTDRPTATGAAGFDPVPIGTGATRAVLSPDGTAVYVANTDSDTVSVLDAESGATVATVEVGGGPLAVSVSSDGSRVWVPCRRGNEVVLIDVDDDYTTAPIPIDGSPLSLTLTDTAAIVPVASGGLYLIDQESLEVSPYVGFGTKPGLAVVAPDGAVAYVPDQGSGVVVGVPLADPEGAYPIDVPGTPLSVEVSPDGTRGYAPDRSGQLLVLDLENDTALDPIPLPGQPGRIALSDDGTRAWVGDFTDQQLLLVDLTTGRVQRTYDLGAVAGPVEIDPSGRWVAVADADAAQLLVVDTTTLEERRLDTGEVPGLVTPGADGSVWYVVSDTDPATVTAVVNR